ncbi:hypothetical protein SDC9_21447 [bioreactor metagenome]|uniref:Uncharacterized protein n=1 Tax=bioreactor metagenome TaxID=1076179 RepID=A0A644U9K4_9ZZZZ|nr:hypothetical protein [Methanobrevibacter sp.]MEA4956728.1 hypothetical protein [Methanobrevibacter sp.]
MIILVVLVVGIASLSILMPGIFDPITDKFSNNSHNDSNTSKHTAVKKTSDIKIEPKEGYSEITINGMKGFIKSDYNNFVIVNNKTKYNGLDGYLNLTANKSVDFVDYNSFSQLVAKNGSFSIVVTNDSNIENPLNRINSEYAANNVNNDTNIMLMGNNLRIINYNDYSTQNFTGEMTWAYFTVNGKDVAIGWQGDNLDMYVIESFFKLN